MCFRAVTSLLETAADSVPGTTYVRCHPRMRLNLTQMAGSRSCRFGATLLLVLVAGCSAAPAALLAQPATAAQVVPPTPEPTATERTAPTPTVAPTVAPAPTSVAAPPEPTPAPTAAPQN